MNDIKIFMNEYFMQTTQTSEIDKEIFATPSNVIIADRFSSESQDDDMNADLRCKPGCSGVCAG